MPRSAARYPVEPVETFGFTVPSYNVMVGSDGASSSSPQEASSGVTATAVTTAMAGQRLRISPVYPVRRALDTRRLSAAATAGVAP